jgi:hypothetical protein
VSTSRVNPFRSLNHTTARMRSATPRVIAPRSTRSPASSPRYVDTSVRVICRVVPATSAIARNGPIAASSATSSSVNPPSARVAHDEYTQSNSPIWTAAPSRSTPAR